MKKIIQFGYKAHAVPEGMPLVDCRVIPNPYKIKDPVAQKHVVRSHPEFKTLVMKGLSLLEMCDIIGVGCAYGVHRSGMVVQQIQLELLKAGADQVAVDRLNKTGIA